MSILMGEHTGARAEYTGSLLLLKHSHEHRSELSPRRCRRANQLSVLMQYQMHHCMHVPCPCLARAAKRCCLRPAGVAQSPRLQHLSWQYRSPCLPHARSFEVRPGPEGYRHFTESIRKAFKLPDDSELNITFTCDEPSTAELPPPPPPPPPPTGAQPHMVLTTRCSQEAMNAARRQQPNLSCLRTLVRSGDQ